MGTAARWRSGDGLWLDQGPMGAGLADRAGSIGGIDQRSRPGTGTQGDGGMMKMVKIDIAALERAADGTVT